MFNLLHTSDWHLGRTLYGKKRYEEQEKFLLWLSNLIEDNAIDGIVIAGDIFDTVAPSNRSQELYYQFLCRTATSTCRHIVVVGGNHDSPSFLDAPKDLLRALKVYVIGAATENIEDEVLVLHDVVGKPELIVCAVPYLRDRDVRMAATGESMADKDRKMAEGIARHYEDVVKVAEEKRAALGTDIPIVGTGHLFTAGGKTLADDGVRDLYIGSLAYIGVDSFPKALDYLALGHLHIPQRVSGSEILRYSGSPIPMGFGEAKQQKHVVKVCFEDKQPVDSQLEAMQPLENQFVNNQVLDKERVENQPMEYQQLEKLPVQNQLSNCQQIVEPIPVPCFQKLESLQGDWAYLSERLSALTRADENIWLEVTYTGDTVMPDLRERLYESVAGTTVEILRIQNKQLRDKVLTQDKPEETLDDLNVADVFERCLAMNSVPEDQCVSLRQTYKQLLLQMQDAGEKAEL